MDRNYRYSFNKRLHFTFYLFCVFFIILIWRLWSLQLKYGDEYVNAIRRQCIRTVRLSPIRGRITSQDGYIYADNIPSFDLEFYIPQFRRRRLGPLNSTIEYIRYQIEELNYFLGNKLKLSDNDLKIILEKNQKHKLFSFNSINYGAIDGLFLDKRFFQVIENAKSIEIFCLPSLKRLNIQGQRTRTAQAVAKTIQKIDDIIGRYPNHIPKDVRQYLIKKNKQDTLQQLEKELNFSLEVFRRHMRSVLFNYHVSKVNYHIMRTPALAYVGLKNLTKREISKITEVQPPFIGVDLRLNPTRHYNNSEEIAHIIGYLQKQEFKEKEFDDFFYFQEEYYGRSGIEKKLNGALAGRGAMQLLQVDIAGFFKESIKDVKYLKVLKQQGQTKNGYNVTLTIDANAQNIAYNLMKDHTGALVVMDCTNGEIKAMVSTPSYNLNNFRNNYSSLINDKELPFSNRASLAGYLPGSIIKPIIALAALKKYNINPLETYICEGRYKIAKNYTISCAVRHGHGEINLFEALEQSCNPYFINLGVRCGIDSVREMCRNFGIGQPIDLPLTQLGKGLLPGSQKRWNKTETCYVSIGQGKIGISPLQVAIFTSLIANKGKFYQPRIIKNILDPYTNKVILKGSVKLIKTLDIEDKYWNMIHYGMRQVINGKNATAKAAQTENGVKVAGKTGTVERQISEKKYKYLVNLGKSVKTKGRYFYTKDTWFTCFAPYDKPRYAIVVFVESGESGGKTSVPIARAFLDKWLGEKGNE